MSSVSVSETSDTDGTVGSLPVTYGRGVSVLSSLWVRSKILTTNVVSTGPDLRARNLSQIYGPRSSVDSFLYRDIQGRREYRSRQKTGFPAEAHQGVRTHVTLVLTGSPCRKSVGRDVYRWGLEISSVLFPFFELWIPNQSPVLYRLRGE